MNKKINFPSLPEAIYRSFSMDEIWQNYINDLRKDNSMYSKLYASKLEELQDMKEKDKLIELEQEFYSLKELLRQLQEELGIHLLLTRRQKDFIGLNEKIRLFLRKGAPLEKVRDLLGFRVVLCSDSVDSNYTIESTYKVLNKIIEFFIEDRNCLLAEAEPLLDLGFNIEEHSDIIVPPKSLIMESFISNVKDYICTPKGNGYQGLHVIVKKPNGLVFEIQVRTMAMDIRAEYGSAKHDLHKDDRYEGENIDIDFFKINIPGFTVFHEIIDDKQITIVYDLIGLSKSVDPFNFI